MRRLKKFSFKNRPHFTYCFGTLSTWHDAGVFLALNACKVGRGRSDGHDETIPIFELRSPQNLPSACRPTLNLGFINIGVYLFHITDFSLLNFNGFGAVGLSNITHKPMKFMKVILYMLLTRFFQITE